jgi:hypothetical protein
MSRCAGSTEDNWQLPIVLHWQWRLTFAADGTTVSFVLRRWTTIFLFGVMLTLGSGAVQFAHNRDAHLGEAHHDEGTCLVHALMHGPMLDTGVTPALVCLGVFVAFLTMLSSQPATQKVFTRLDCRGPPAALLISA